MNNKACKTNIMIATLTSIMPECFQGRILYCNNFLKIQTHYCYFLKKRKQRKQSSNQAYRDCKCNLFSIMVTLKKYFTILVVQNFVQNTKKHT